jgi:hypothetical protein
MHNGNQQYLTITNFRLSRSVSLDVNSALGCLYLVNIDIIVDVSEIHDATIFAVDIQVPYSTLTTKVEAECTYETSAALSTSTEEYN